MTNSLDVMFNNHSNLRYNYTNNSNNYTNNNNNSRSYYYKNHY